MSKGRWNVSRWVPTGVSMGVTLISAAILVSAGTAQAQSTPAPATAPEAVVTTPVQPEVAPPPRKDDATWPAATDSAWLAMLLVGGIVAATLLDKQRH